MLRFPVWPTRPFGVTAACGVKKVLQHFNLFATIERGPVHVKHLALFVSIVNLIFLAGATIAASGTPRVITSARTS